MTSQKVSVEVAAKILGMSPNEVRYKMKKEINVPRERRELPIGQARRSRSGKSFRYDVYRNLLMTHVGLTEWPEGGDR